MVHYSNTAELLIMDAPIQEAYCRSKFLGKFYILALLDLRVLYILSIMFVVKETPPIIIMFYISSFL